jgi:hypothetical protein
MITLILVLLLIIINLFILYRVENIKKEIENLINVCINYQVKKSKTPKPDKPALEPTPTAEIISRRMLNIETFGIS